MSLEPRPQNINEAAHELVRVWEPRQRAEWARNAHLSLTNRLALFMRNAAAPCPDGFTRADCTGGFIPWLSRHNGGAPAVVTTWEYFSEPLAPQQPIPLLGEVVLGMRDEYGDDLPLTVHFPSDVHTTTCDMINLGACQFSRPCVIDRVKAIHYAHTDIRTRDQAVDLPAVW